MTSDNTFGTAREDALRRDFTINGLFYDISDFSVIDYVGGLDDLEAGLVRTIGDPQIRFREDPVRMMRAVEFASRLGFAITPDSYEAILECRKEIVKSAPPRVTEELLQSLKGGHALPTFLLLREVGLLDVLLPELAHVLREIDPDHPHGTGHLFWALLDVLDAERRRGRSFDDAVLFALFFLPIARARVREEASEGDPDPALLSTILEDLVSADRSADVAAPRGFPQDQAGARDGGPVLAPARPADRDPAPRLSRGVSRGPRRLRARCPRDRPRAKSSAREWRAFAARAEKTRESFVAEAEAEKEAAPAAPRPGGGGAGAGGAGRRAAVRRPSIAAAGAVFPFRLRDLQDLPVFPFGTFRHSLRLVLVRTD